MKPTAHGVSCISISTLLLATLTACGGGGYGGGGGGGGVMSYTVGGMVSGLTGTGLVLRDNGGNDLPLAADGAFAFSTKIVTGAAYSVTVYTQPVSPAQTCVVTNGSGTMGSSNIANVAVSCTLNGFTGFVGGPYLYTDIEFDYASTGPDLLDGAGAYTGSYVQNVSGVISSGSFSGTYTAAAGGAMNLGGQDGGVSADGNTLVFARLQVASVPYVDVEIKQGQTNFTNADFSGTYQVVSITSMGDASRSLTLTANGAGGYSGTEVQNNAGVITNGAVNGTYAVAADGSLTITPASGSPLSGGISADGKTLVLSQLTALQPGAFAVGVKQGQSAFTNADVVGTYKIIDYEQLGNGTAALLLTLYFDGSGMFNGSATVNDAGTISNLPVTGTYTVASDGTLTVSPVGGTSFTGGVSSDGNTLVFTDLNSGDTPATDVGVRL